MRSTVLLPQLAAIRARITSAAFASSLFLISWGLTKKLVFADNFGDIVDNMEIDTAGAGITYTYAFAFQIYCDFSAYSDIAIGTAKLFNVELRRNFLTPYLAQNPSDFWDRWHISLSSWLRDYLYIPLGGNRGTIAKTFRNLFLTMVLCGMWHGAGYLYAIWGFYHGALLVLYRLFPIDAHLRAILGLKIGAVAAMVLMFNLTCIGWAFFRAHSGAELQTLWDQTESLFSFDIERWAQFWSYFRVFLLFAVPIMATEIIGFRNGCEFPDLRDRMPWWLQAILYVVFFYVIVLFAKRTANAFIYFQF